MFFYKVVFRGSDTQITFSSKSLISVIQITDIDFLPNFFPTGNVSVSA